MTVGKVITNILVVVAIIIFIWLFASWIDTIICNDSVGVHHWWNFFKIFVETF